jgi:hypothetical protein
MHVKKRSCKKIGAFQMHYILIVVLEDTKTNMLVTFLKYLFLFWELIVILILISNTNTKLILILILISTKFFKSRHPCYSD